MQEHTTLLLFLNAFPTCHESIQSGVKACTMCLPGGANEGSRSEGMDTNRVPYASSSLHKTM